MNIWLIINYSIINYLIIAIIRLIIMHKNLL